MKHIMIAVLVCLTANQTLAMNHGGKAHQDQMQHTQAQSTFVTQTEDGLTFADFSVRARIGMAPNSAAYGEITIADGSDTLIAAQTSVAERVELHEHLHDNGVMRMREVQGGFSISSDQPLEMKPGGLHIMLLGVKGPLQAGTDIDLRLEFASGKVINLTVPVVTITSMRH